MKNNCSVWESAMIAFLLGCFLGTLIGFFGAIFCIAANRQRDQVVLGDEEKEVGCAPCAETANARRDFSTGDAFITVL